MKVSNAQVASLKSFMAQKLLVLKKWVNLFRIFLIEARSNVDDVPCNIRKLHVDDAKDTHTQRWPPLILGCHFAKAQKSDFKKNLLLL